MEVGNRRRAVAFPDRERRGSGATPAVPERLSGQRLGASDPGGEAQTLEERRHVVSAHS